jgi:3-hydroxyacyl-CoA dehydrogenase
MQNLDNLKEQLINQLTESCKNAESNLEKYFSELTAEEKEKMMPLKKAVEELKSIKSADKMIEKALELQKIVSEYAD